MQFGNRSLDLSVPRIMGILNVTPDSFSDGGRFCDLNAAVSHALAMCEAGADFIDVGGESTRPGAQPVSVQEELDRVCPVVETLLKQTDALISVDTSTPEVMQEVIALGVHLINDVRAFSRPGAAEVVRDAPQALCIMHMQGEPATMQDNPQYDNVVEDIRRFLLLRAQALTRTGINSRRILIDPGFGFGKTLAHNVALLKGLDRFADIGYPVLVGMSRKRMIGELTGRETPERVVGSAVAAAMAVERGAAIVRVHDVAQTRDAIRVAMAVREMKEYGH
ncbi:dihydropteroate synthase [Hahella sp. SMD15-11]|uniref:Dihydropteroate synthase n=1 Tax=Thermohahella caldifontis TaxID=3142973 RepID=A0AB39UVD8_9GAMM